MSEYQPSVTGGRDVHTVRFPDGVPPWELDVLIVGAGPVGLSSAIELAGRGVRVAVVDRARTATLIRAGAMGHTARTVEHFRRWGVLQEIRTEWTFPPEWVHGIKLITSLTGHELVPNRRPSFTDRGTGDRADRHSLADRIRRPQTALQQVFLNHLGRHGVPVTGGWQLGALHEHADWIDAEVAGVDSGEHRTIRARYVLGADGGSSTVRRLAGIGRDGERAALKRLRLIVRTGDESERLGPAPSGVNLVFNAKAWSFLAAVSTREWRVYAGPYPLDYEPTNEELIEIGQAAFGFDLDLEVASATTYYDSSRVAQRFRKGRVLLAGDAAHVRTPGGNLGEGFGDVANLGWKLAAVLDGRAPEALLDSYDAERRRHNWRIADYALERARRGYKLREQIRRDGIPDDSDLSSAAQQRRAEIGALIGQGRFESAGVEFDERYDASAAIWYEPGQVDTEEPWQSDRYEDDPRPGHRAPDGYLDPWGDTLYDRIGNDFALLVLTEDAATGQAFAAEAAARSLPLSVIHLPDPAARELYGADNVLIRPDQHVAWRGAQVPDGGAAAVLDLVLGRARQERDMSETTFVTDYTGPEGLHTRGTVLVVPGRGESEATYQRFGRRLAADSYRVRVLPAPVIAEDDLAGSLERFAWQLADAVTGTGADGPVRPLVLVGSDTGAAGLAALVAWSVTQPAALDPSWWPQALVLAALPGYAAHQLGGWDEELDVRTHCSVHRGVLSDDLSVQRGTLSGAVPRALLDAAYASTADLPQLLLVGDADPLADRYALAQAAKALPAARLVVVHGAHHDVLNDLQHRSVAAEVVTFLEALRNAPSLEPVVTVGSSAW